MFCYYFFYFPKKMYLNFIIIHTDPESSNYSVLISLHGPLMKRNDSKCPWAAMWKIIYSIYVANKSQFVKMGQIPHLTLLSRVFNEIRTLEEIKKQVEKQANNTMEVEWNKHKNVSNSLVYDWKIIHLSSSRNLVRLG